MNIRTFRIFYERELSEFLESNIRALEDEVNGRPDNYILNINETEFIDFLTKRFSIEDFELNFDAITSSIYEQFIPAGRFPSGFNVYSGKSYPKDIIRYYIPFTGDKRLLYCVPSSRLLWSIDVDIEENCICFDIINFYDDPDVIKNEANSNITHIRSQYNNVLKELREYNEGLSHRAQQIFQNRKKHLLKKNDLVAALGIPIRRRDDVPETFAIPAPPIRKKIQVAPPVSIEKGFTPEPTLDNAIYQEILQIIQDVGKQFERMPSTYASKDEESLRDHFLLVLEPRFEGSATGETFNKGGKTDILLRYEGTNVFIAECKFWKGAKLYHDTINQLLGYLNWRDSKSAIILFVQNKDFSSVIRTVENESPNHPNYLGFVSKKDETWLNYRFHINGDINREVKLAVLLFHIPPPDQSHIEI